MMERPPRIRRQDAVERPGRRSRKGSMRQSRNTIIMCSLSWTKDLVNPLTKLVNPDLLLHEEDLHTPRPVEVILFVEII